MSYSFSLRAANADEAKTKTASKFQDVTTQQPIHARDAGAAIKVVRELAAIITIPEGKELAISVSGSVGWSGVAGDDQSQIELTSAGLNVSVSLAPKEEKKQPVGD